MPPKEYASCGTSDSMRFPRRQISGTSSSEWRTQAYPLLWSINRRWPKARRERTEQSPGRTGASRQAIIPMPRYKVQQITERNGIITLNGERTKGKPDANTGRKNNGARAKDRHPYAGDRRKHHHYARSYTASRARHQKNLRALRDNGRRTERPGTTPEPAPDNTRRTHRAPHPNPRQTAAGSRLADIKSDSKAERKPRTIRDTSGQNGTQRRIPTRSESHVTKPG